MAVRIPASNCRKRDKLGRALSEPDDRSGRLPVCRRRHVITDLGTACLRRANGRRVAARSVSTIGSLESRVWALAANSLEKCLPGLVWERQVRGVWLLGVAYRHQPGQVAGHFHAVAALAAVTALAPLGAGQVDLWSSRAPPPCPGTTSRCGPAVRSPARSRLGAVRRPATGQMQGYSGSHPNAPRGRCPRRASRRTPRPGRWAPGSPG